jgi:hypothetical protein
MKIRQIGADERQTQSVPLQAYGFQPSPATASTLDTLHHNQQYYSDNVTLAAEDGGAIVAEASAIPMRQNVRGSIYPMAGVAGVVSTPLVRRRGHVRSVLVELLGRMRDEGHVVSALYPFRPSFYQRFGYVGLPQTRTVRFSPASLVDLLHAGLDGEILWEPVREGYDAYCAFTDRLLLRRHGFAVLPAYRTAQLREANERWLVTARVRGEVVAAMTYRTTGHGGELIGDDLLMTSALGRALVLQFVAGHVDQVATFVVTVAPDELPELWATDLDAVTQARTSVPTLSAPMARILEVEALRGMSVGPGRVAVEIVDDPFIAGPYMFDSDAGVLDVSRARTPESAATLTSAGLAGLIYGVLAPDDIVVRGLGTMSMEGAVQLQTLFPRCVPYVCTRY